MTIKYFALGDNGNERNVTFVICAMAIIAVLAIIFVSFSAVYLIRLKRTNNILEWKEVSYEEFNSLSPQNKQIAYNNALDIFQSGDLSTEESYRFENALHLIIQHYQQNLTNSENFRNKNLQFLLNEFWSKITKSIAQESFENWINYVLYPENSNPFAIVYSTCFSKLERKNFENGKFNSYDLDKKFKESLNNIKSLFIISDDKSWNQIEKIVLNYPPQSAINLLMNDKDLGISIAVNAALFWDIFYTSTGISMNIPKCFETANISNKIIDFQRNIKNWLQFVLLYKQLKSNDNKLSTCKKKLPFENSFQNLETEYATKDSYKWQIVGSDIEVPIRKAFISRSLINAGSNVSTVHSSYFVPNKLEKEETKDHLNDKDQDSKRTTVNCDH